MEWAILKARTSLFARKTSPLHYATATRDTSDYSFGYLAGWASERSPNVDLNVICKQMGRSPDWMPDIVLRANGYETQFYKKV